MGVEERRIDIRRWKTEVLREKPVALSICTQEILHILNRPQTFASGPSGRHLEA
jgi:hypothetical protein